MFKVEGLPDGWAVKEVHIDPDQYNKYVGDDGFLYWEAKIKMEKIQPRRIVLESTGEKREPVAADDYFFNSYGNLRSGNSLGVFEIWREVKETDIPLNNDEPKLKMGVSHGGDAPKLELSVDECKALLFGSWEPIDKMREFIKDK